MEFKDYAKKVVSNFKESVRGGVKTYLTRNDLGEVSTYIAETKDDIWEGTTTYATIGLLKENTGYEYEGKPLVTELVAVINSKEEGFANVLGSIVTNTKYFGKESVEGSVHEDVVSQYYPNATTRHIVLTQSVFWEGLYTLDIGDKVLAWLSVIPITDDELVYLEHNGLDSLLNKLEDKGANVSDLERVTSV